LTLNSEYRNIMDMKQVAAAIERRGGKAKVAAIAGAVLSAPYRRRQEKSGGGTGGPVPQAPSSRTARSARISDPAR
jgi:hypothetical protein